MVSPLQQVYLEQLCDALRPGGVGWVQVPVLPLWSGHLIRRGPDKELLPKSCSGADSERAGGMQMHGTPKADVVEMMQRRGCAIESAQPSKGLTSRLSQDVVLLLRKRRQ